MIEERILTNSTPLGGLIRIWLGPSKMCSYLSAISTQDGSFSDIEGARSTRTIGLNAESPVRMVPRDDRTVIPLTSSTPNAWDKALGPRLPASSASVKMTRAVRLSERNAPCFSTPLSPETRSIHSSATSVPQCRLDYVSRDRSGNATPVALIDQRLDVPVEQLHFDKLLVVDRCVQFTIIHEPRQTALLERETRPVTAGSASGFIGRLGRADDVPDKIQTLLEGRYGEVQVVEEILPHGRSQDILERIRQRLGPLERLTERLGGLQP